MNLTAHILTIGDELLIGQIVNTNAAWLGEQLEAQGVRVERMLTIGDDAARIHQALDTAIGAADLCFITGGLGPTHDDITKTALAEYFALDVVLNPAVYEQISAFYEQRGRLISAAGRQMAHLPKNFEVLDNPTGTAPGMWYRADHPNGATYLVVMPGVPGEMKAIFQTSLRPRLTELVTTLRAERQLGVIRHLTLRTAGAGESVLSDRLGPDLHTHLDETCKLAFLPSAEHGVRLRISTRGPDLPTVDAKMAALKHFIYNQIGDMVYAEGEVDLEAAVGAMLAEKGLTIALAESCTGGLLAHRLTNVSGSSAYMMGGIVAYDNTVKMQQLGVSPDTLETHGAVSKAVALEMAQGVRQRLGTDIGVATTGIAGPTGGTPEKPVGTIWMAYADDQTAYAVHRQLTRHRGINKTLTTTITLNLIRRQMLRRFSS